ncbi:MAG: hypothetical protein JW806_04220 [Sedimentisphaerales bacterium]|nr:hypothetical protein [Sedimentisphaerales bacterium]
MARDIYTLSIFFIVIMIIFTSFAVGSNEDPHRRVEQSYSPEPTKTHQHGMDEFINWFHNPTDRLTMGADIRWRYVYSWNIDTIQDDAAGRSSKWHYTRNRFRWWTKSRITDDIDFNHRWVWEFRTWDDPYRKDKRMNWDEIVWDRFNITMRNFADMPLTVVLGRQDIKLGNAWLVLDATKDDGSRTAYFDAIRLIYQVPDKETTLDLIYIDQRADSAAWLKPIGDKDRLVGPYDEKGAIAYVTDKSRENLQLEGYFIYKNDNPVNSGTKSEIYTFGGAMEGPIGSSEKWKYRIEGAVQGGDKGTEDRIAYGTVNKLEYHFNDEKKNMLHVSLEYLSGDDPETSKYEQFDLLWGKWPQWDSEIAIYSYTLETAHSDVTNVQRIAFGHSFWPTDKIQICTDYHLLWADENTKKDSPHSSGLVWSDDGKFRGQLATFWVKYEITKQLKGHFMVEYFCPGNYYEQSSRDGAFFTRVNIEYTF